VRSLLTRRNLLVGGFVMARFSPTPEAVADYIINGDDETRFNPRRMPPAESKIDFPIKPVDPGRISKRYRRQIVEFDGAEGPGTVVVDPDNRFLYFVEQNNQATRFGVGVGRSGFGWSGKAVIGKKRRWPRWVPPPEMVNRDDNAARWVNGMPGGPDNPLGARALYLYQDGEDTQYRIHGTNQPSSIGKAMSSGCIRMLNEDVATLYDLCAIGTPVVVRPSAG
jgi:lipoprotein-anchoring transpeptidase ErfK/SrfK